MTTETPAVETAPETTVREPNYLKITKGFKSWAGTLCSCESVTPRLAVSMGPRTELTSDISAPSEKLSVFGFQFSVVSGQFCDLRRWSVMLSCASFRLCPRRVCHSLPRYHRQIAGEHRVVLQLAHRAHGNAQKPGELRVAVPSISFGYVGAAELLALRI